MKYINYKNIKLIFVILVTIICIFSISTFCEAKQEVITDFSPFKPNPEDPGSDISELVGKAIGVVQIVGIIASVAILIVIGIKYMMASTEGKADYKETAMPYIIGAVLIFAAPTLVNLIYVLANHLSA